MGCNLGLVDQEFVFEELQSSGFLGFGSESSAWRIRTRTQSLNTFACFDALRLDMHAAWRN